MAGVEWSFLTNDASHYVILVLLVFIAGSIVSVVDIRLTAYHWMFETETLAVHSLVVFERLGDDD